MTSINQIEFSKALLDPSVVFSSVPKSRLDIYRNNVTASLVNALMETFKICSAIVGEEFFKAMALYFVRRNPPKSPILTLYGSEFSAFIKDFPPASSVAYLSDVANLEYARVVTFHCADEVSDHTPEVQLALDTVISLTKNSQIIRSEFALYDIWVAHLSDECSGQIEISSPQSILIFRQHNQVQVIAISDLEASFFEHLKQGNSLLQACEKIMAKQSDEDILFDPKPSINLLIKHSLIAKTTTNFPQEHP
jgi:hypothetical protein